MGSRNESDPRRSWWARLVKPEGDTSLAVLIALLLVFCAGTVYGFNELVDSQTLLNRVWAVVLAVVCFVATARIIGILRDRG